MASGIRTPHARLRLRRSTLVGVVPWECDGGGEGNDAEAASPC
ncbi:hypothetical protein E7V67_013035 [[Empedobacter] haloabium]|uniref:Uncharacterized protein n=1 Tax=[Empedobacter] haloabium TaxID=592317 RepID=A0ABZ1UTA1_9BURK